MSESDTGQKVSDETRQKIRDNQIFISGSGHPAHGRKHTPEERQLMTNNHIDYSGENHPGWGKFHSDATILQMSNSAIGKKKSGQHSSKYVGVYYRKNAGKFVSNITYVGKNFYLGAYDIEEDAAMAYNNKAKELLGIYYDINIIDKKEDT